MGKLEAACTFLDVQASELEIEAYPLLDELKGIICRLSLGQWKLRWSADCHSVEIGVEETAGVWRMTFYARSERLTKWQRRWWDFEHRSIFKQYFLQIMFFSGQASAMPSGQVGSTNIRDPNCFSQDPITLSSIRSTSQLQASSCNLQLQHRRLHHIRSTSAPGHASSTPPL